MPILSESNMNVPDMKGVVLANPEPVAGRRISLPARQPTHPSFSLLAILRSNIGRDLTKLKLPVVLNEPLSTLQNQCEELEYSHLLDAASEMEEQTKRMLYVTTFAISAYARTASRTATMPFTPLLGETFECVRPERQWRFLGEQVSHNPPVTASHCESKLWSLYQEFNMKSKFWGKWQETYTWNKVTTSITNVFSPTTLSIDHTGDLTIKCSNGASSTVHFNQHDSKRPDVRRYVCGTVNPPKGSSEDPRLLYGHWDKILVSRDENGENRCIWRANPLPPNSAHYYGFTKFAIELNEPPVADAVSSGRLPITDSRLRPDQRFLELGRIEEAEIEKTRLEDEQRHRLKMHKTTENSRDRSSSSIWKPHWFTYKPKSVPATDQGPSYEFNPAYWRFRDSCGFKDLKLPILW
uniref:Oxysterol-binding protein n=1 Tax=Mesocestoides corti TaxID=53468 RepID=A0A5K3FUU4_MESCO